MLKMYQGSNLQYVNVLKWESWGDNMANMKQVNKVSLKVFCLVEVSK